MENPCLRCHTCAAALSHSGAIIGFGVVASRARLHERWTAISADAVAYSKINSVVLQFNDLWLRRGWSQRNVRRYSRVVGKLSARECGTTIATAAILFLRSSRRQHAR